MERHRCKLCFRNFSNGRALGGHMRSHMMNLYAAKNQEKIQENDDFEPGFFPCSSTSPSSSAAAEEREKEENDPVLVQDRESETESSKEKTRPVHRRSKRARKSRIFYSRTGFNMDDFLVMKKKSEVEAEQMSSISDTTTEEDVAYCLMMLSRDKWEENREIKNNQEMEKNKSTKVRGKYRCDTCNKLFRSYQALGGHRASHKRIKIDAAAPAGEKGRNENSGGCQPAEVVVEKVHECPFCHRVFSSGQALGGHKRSHFVGASAISSNVYPSKQFSRTGETLDIDLNLPPQDYEDDEISQIAISAVSDAEFFQEN